MESIQTNVKIMANDIDVTSLQDRMEDLIQFVADELDKPKEELKDVVLKHIENIKTDIFTNLTDPHEKDTLLNEIKELKDCLIQNFFNHVEEKVTSTEEEEESEDSTCTDVVYVRERVNGESVNKALQVDLRGEFPDTLQENIYNIIKYAKENGYNINISIEL